ncbi:extracellular serine/threonine protein kinase four-jointed [Maniola hyperantus]|uniref:extracellular serine/threonine protein kinase four-jointed n=1 Tax=Aphantopus hyperantus TaxID=2795564 RepID=UPI0015693CD1|nr:extracellular serine/threonine protein kinase four-jointed [Maniola hyperantus]
MATFTQIVEDRKDVNKQCGTDRLPTLKDIEKDTETVAHNKLKTATTDMDCYRIKNPCLLYNNFRYKKELSRVAMKREYGFYSYCFISVCLSFILGLLIGVAIVGSPETRVISPSYSPRKLVRINTTRDGHSRSLNSLKLTDNFKVDKDYIFSEKEKDRFATVSFTGAIEPHKYKMDVYPKGLTDDMKEILKDNKVSRHKHTILNVINTTSHVPNDETVLYENIYWGPEVENSMPQGYGENSAEIWERYVNQSEIVKMETGCGRMQNRLVTFRDGIQACVRYRQNTDQIQGEIFSFYVARLLNLTNVAPSVVKVVDLKDKLWQSVTNDIATAQWNTNRAVVLTQYIPSLEPATIPEVFKPSTRHLNKIDVFKISFKENATSDTSKQILIDKLRLKNVKTKKEEVENFDYIDAKLNRKTIDLFVELAQWSDLIIFDYLTANLDRIVNNLFNYQWNINIMDGPAHNLARKMDSGLLLFLDNESGLLHGYRLLKKYNMYHSLMLDNLCVFRKKTVDALKLLYDTSIGSKLSDIFHTKNNAVIRDILPPLPEKNAKILHDRIGKVLSQIEKCEQTFLNTR